MKTYRVILPVAERRVNEDDVLVDADQLEITAAGALAFWRTAPASKVQLPVFLRAFSPSAWHSVQLVVEAL